MQIFVRGVNGGHITLDVAPNATIADVAEAIESQEFIPVARLMCGGKQLVAGTLADYNVAEADTLTILMNVQGGMRAKWRKKRMRRLRRKRRKMRQRAR